MPILSWDRQGLDFLGLIGRLGFFAVRPPVAAARFSLIPTPLFHSREGGNLCGDSRIRR